MMAIYDHTPKKATSIKITVSAELSIDGLPDSAALTFIKDNTFANPKRATLERLGKWTGDTPKTIELWRRQGEMLFLPRGYLPAVISRLRGSKLAFTIQDSTVAPALYRKLEITGTLYPYQEEALANLLRYRSGVLEAPTGCGKGNILLSLIPRLNTPSLIIVHTAELLEQTCERVRAWLGVEPAVIGGGKFDLKPVTVV
jgi:hypothetical protein